MKVLFLVLLLQGMMLAQEPFAQLGDIQVTKGADSVVIDLHFQGQLPEKYRVHLDQDSSGNMSVTASFLKALPDSSRLAKRDIPPWLAYVVRGNGESQMLQVHVFVGRKVVYRSEWNGSVFRVVLPNAIVEKSPFWKKPWLYVGIAAAGGAILWLTTGGGSSSNGDENIAPPDIILPE